MHLDIRDHIFIIRTGHLKKTPYGFCRKERGSVKDLLDRYYQYTGADTNTILSCSHCHSHASCGPQSRCCSQTADCIIADKDHTCTQETYTGYDLCRHTGGIYLFYIVKTILGYYHHKRRPQRYDSMGSHTCAFITVFSFIADHVPQYTGYNNTQKQFCICRYPYFCDHFCYHFYAPPFPSAKMSLSTIFSC